MRSRLLSTSVSVRYQNASTLLLPSDFSLQLLFFSLIFDWHAGNFHLTTRAFTGSI
jgi:hypothetical protein